MSATQESQRREAFERRIEAYHDVTVADVLEVIDYVRDRPDSVVVGGSLALELGNRLSDLDVVVCGPNTKPSRVPLEHWAKSLRVDVWLREQADIDRLFERAQAALDSDAPIQGALGSADEEQQLKLLHRVAFGLVIDGPPLAPAATRDPLEVARDLLVREYAERMRESACVAQLAADAELWLAATVNARLAVEEALHAVLAARGVPFTGDKWLRERLKSVAPELGAEYRPYAALPDGAGESSAFAAGAVELSGELTGVDLSAERLAGELTWRGEDLELRTVGGDHLLVSPPIGGLWRLDEEQAQAWESLAARSGGDGPLAFAAGDCDPAESRLCLHLYERGLVSPSWGRGLPLSELSIAAAEAA